MVDRPTTTGIPRAGSIWSTHEIDKTVGSGLFVCPGEQTERAYWLHQVRTWRTFFSVPVIPGRVTEEFVECFCCGATWDPRVVGSRHPALGTSLHG